MGTVAARATRRSVVSESRGDSVYAFCNRRPAGTQAATLEFDVDNTRVI